MIETLLTPTAVKTLGERVADDQLAVLEQELQMTNAEMLEMIRIGQLQAKTRQRAAAARDSAVEYDQPVNRTQSQQQNKQQLAVAEDNVVKIGTNTGFVSKLKAERGFRGDNTINNVAEAVEARKSWAEAIRKEHKHQLRDRIKAIKERTSHSRTDESHGLMGFRNPTKEITILGAETRKLAAERQQAASQELVHA